MEDSILIFKGVSKVFLMSVFYDLGGEREQPVNSIKRAYDTVRGEINLLRAPIEVCNGCNVPHVADSDPSLFCLN